MKIIQDDKNRDVGYCGNNYGAVKVCFSIDEVVTFLPDKHTPHNFQKLLKLPMVYRR